MVDKYDRAKNIDYYQLAATAQLETITHQNKRISFFYKLYKNGRFKGNRKTP
jgi:hypothetical protein